MAISGDRLRLIEAGQALPGAVGRTSTFALCNATLPYARAIAEKFRPDKIILFGSFAYGTPREGSDVDLLVIMPAWSQGAKAGRIRMALCAPFAMDLIVRTPDTMKWRLEERDSFLREIVSKGKVLYEKG